MAVNEVFWLDDRGSANLEASNGERWRLVTDNVMGGVSDGNLTVDTVDDRACLRMTGEVKLDNNGGFIQMALDLSPEEIDGIDSYKGIAFSAWGNDETYNIHLRTSNLWLPWQSYRATFDASPEWREIKIPFHEFIGYRLSKPFKITKLKRVGMVAIGRAFDADLCVGKIGLYR